MSMPMSMRVRMGIIHLLGSIRSGDTFLGIPLHAKRSSRGICISGKGLLLPLWYVNIFDIISGSDFGATGVAIVFAVFVRM